MKLFRLIGIVSAFAYTIVILFTWIVAAQKGFVYFQAGEPDLRIMYLEWALGIIGIVTLVDVYKKEIESVN